MSKRLSTLVLCLLLSLSPTLESSQCKGHFVNPITDICWDCLFPLTIGNAALVKSSYPDTKNPKNPLCTCPTDVGARVGITIGYWEPVALVDITRKPWCMVNLGVKLSMTERGLGGSQMTDTDGQGAFYYVHWYKYPLMYWLQVITSLACFEPEHDFDVLYVSELDPMWNDSELSFVLNPEATLFTNPLVRAACAADATQSLVGTANDKLFWCQGAQGSTYPLTGFVANQASPLQAATLLAERTDFKLHRLGAINDSVGKDSPAICHTHASAILPKSRYRYQLVNTLPDAKRCHAFGSTVTSWETGHMKPAEGDNFGFLIWKKRNCCFL